MYRRLSLLFAFALAGFVNLPLSAQETQPPTQRVPRFAAPPAAGRVLAPGVMTVIPPEPDPGATFIGPTPITEITQGIPDLEWTPNFLTKNETLLGLSSNVILRHEVWDFEFAFKPLRMISVNIPQPDGRLEPRLIVYLVYRVRYLGNDLRPEPQQDEFAQITYPSTVPVNYKSRRFFPHIVLESIEYKKSYLDQIIPVAKSAIEARERIGQPLHNSVEITRVPIGLSDNDSDREVWGVATWTDLDPRIDFFSIYIQGLTNAYLFRDEPGALKPGDPPLTGRSVQKKTLRLNFWRAGDALLQHEEELHYGVPIDLDPVKQREIIEQYGLPERLDYLWVYR